MGSFMLRGIDSSINNGAEPRAVCFSCDTMASNQDPGGCTGGTCSANCSGGCHFTCVAYCVDNCYSNCSNFCAAMLVKS